MGDAKERFVEALKEAAGLCPSAQSAVMYAQIFGAAFRHDELPEQGRFLIEEVLSGPSSPLPPGKFVHWQAFSVLGSDAAVRMGKLCVASDATRVWVGLAGLHAVAQALQESIREEAYRGRLDEDQRFSCRLEADLLLLQVIDARKGDGLSVFARGKPFPAFDHALDAARTYLRTDWNAPIPPQEADACIELVARALARAALPRDRLAQLYAFERIPASAA